MHASGREWRRGREGERRVGGGGKGGCHGGNENGRIVICRGLLKGGGAWVASRSAVLSGGNLDDFF